MGRMAASIDLLKRLLPAGLLFLFWSARAEIVPVNTLVGKAYNGNFELSYEHFPLNSEGV